MPTWSEYRKIAGDRGSLALELYVVISIPAGTTETIAANLPAHLAYQTEMERAGKLALAGPLSDPSGEQMSGRGLIVYRAGTMNEARAIADADPMHASGAKTYELRKWLVNEGSLTLNVGLSTGRALLS